MILCKLSIRAVGVMSEFAHLTVCNGFLEDIAKGYEYLELTLPQGLYSITLKLDGHIIKKNIRLEFDSEHTLKTPPVYSSLVADKFESSYAYYSENAVRYSKQPTASLSDTGGSLFLFFRYSDFVCSQELNKERKSLGEGFYLLDSTRNFLCQLQGTKIKEDLYNGWMAFNAVLRPGTYYLRYYNIREMTLQVFSNDWQTQVFLTFGTTPIFPSMSIMISPIQQGFIPDDESNYHIDGMRHKLHNSVYYIPEKVLQEFQQGIFTSPMKGLLAAHVYFNSPEILNDELFKSIIPPLADILGKDSPDIQALQILAAQYFNEPLPALKISHPGMFLAGVRAVIYASIDLPDNIKNTIYGDMIWTSCALTPSATPDSIFSIVRQLIATETSPEKIGTQLLSSQPVSTLLHYIENLDNEQDLNDLAARLKISPDMVRKTIGYIRSFSDTPIKDLNT